MIRLQDIALYMPVRNGEDWAAKVPLPSGMRLIALDSGSSDATAKVLRQRGVEVIVAENPRSRTANWRCCLEHFVRSDATWMRWLFAGDVLEEESFTNTLEVAAPFPEVQMIVGGYINHLGSGNTSAVLPVTQTCWLEPEAVLCRSVREGNWFGPPLTVWLHRDLAAKAAYEFGRYEWAADFFAALNAAALNGCLAVPVVQGTFNATERHFFMKNQQSSQARLETLEVRLQALLRLKQTSTAGEQHFQALFQELEKETWIGAFQARVTVENHPEFVQELIRRFPARLILPLLGSRWRRWIGQLGGRRESHRNG